MMRGQTRHKEERGFTIIGVMSAILILSIGILTAVPAFATAEASTADPQPNLIAREKALETLESIFTARNTQQITFSQIANIPNGGIFVSGATPLWSAGNDGLVNTADDLPFPAQGVCAAGSECITLPGPDGILGTPDDAAMSLGNFTRQIEIDPILQPDGSANPNLKQVIVTVSYLNSSPIPRSYRVTALISAFR